MMVIIIGLYIVYSFKRIDATYESIWCVHSNNVFTLDIDIHPFAAYIVININRKGVGLVFFRGRRIGNGV
jgi:hypothetical protein